MSWLTDRLLQQWVPARMAGQPVSQQDSKQTNWVCTAPTTSVYLRDQLVCSMQQLRSSQAINPWQAQAPQSQQQVGMFNRPLVLRKAGF
jgi:hypothetical protein